jgi:hypothetical protein
VNRATLAATLDDFAAVGDYDGAREYGLALPLFSPERKASLRRARAIAARLDGDIAEALEFEQLSERWLAAVAA